MKKYFLPLCFFIAGISTSYAQQTATVDAATYSTIIPTGLTNGDSFRLIFVTNFSESDQTNQSSIERANTRVQTLIASSDITAIRSFSSKFRALVSTEALDARDNTDTNTADGDTDAPIYWFTGDKVADNYADFYDGSWDSRAGKNEDGDNRTPSRIFTGSTSDGTVDTGSGIGATATTLGDLGGDPDSEANGVEGEEIDNGTTSSSSSYTYYGISPVFTIGTPNDSPVVAFSPSGANTTATQSFDLTINVTDADTADTVTAKYIKIAGATACDATATASGTTDITTQIGATNGKTVTITFNSESDNGQKICVEAKDGTETVYTASPAIANIDTTAPGTPTIDLTSDTGTSNIDNITKTLGFTFTNLEAGAAVEKTLDGGTTWTTLTNSFSAVSGTSSIITYATLVSAQADGYDVGKDIELQVRQTDAAGNVSAVSDVLTFTYDATVPTLAAEITDQTATVGTVFSFPIPANTFTDTNTITYTSSGEANGISFNTATNTWEGTPTTAETQTITVTATDAAGNARTDEFNIVIAAAASGTTPTITINQISGDGYVNATEVSSIEISGTSTNIPNGDEITLSFSELEITEANVMVTNNTWTYTIPSGQTRFASEGAGTVTAAYTGATTVERIFTIDTIRPRLVITIPNVDAIVGTDFSFQIPTGTFTDTNTITYTSSALTNGLTFATDTWSGVGASLTAGTVRVTVTAADVAGNTVAGIFDIFISEPIVRTATVDATTHSDIIPSGLTAGDKFRVMFVNFLALSGSSTRTIAEANTHIQDQVTSRGVTAIQSFSSQFTALVSTARIDARDNTGTNTATGSDIDAPIYWLKGNKVADDYEDFYDGNWDVNDSPRSATGGALSISEVVTGSNSNGTVKTGNGLDDFFTAIGNPRTSGQEINEGTNTFTQAHRYYGLSPVFTIDSQTNADLFNLEVSRGTLSPEFTVAATAYTIDVGAADNVVVTPATRVPSSSFAIRGTAADDTTALTVTSDTQVSGLTNGDNTIIITVTSGDTNTTKEYTITATSSIASTSPAISIDAISDGFVNAAEDDSDIAISGTSANIVANQTVTVTFSDSAITDKSATIGADGTWSTAIPTGEMTSATEGTITVTATHATSSATATQTFVYDPSPPTAPTLALSNDSGPDTADGITNVAAVNVGSLEANENWEYEVDGSGTWTAGSGTTFDLTEGASAYKVRQTDEAGNLGAASAAFDFTLDTANPSLVGTGIPDQTADTGTLFTLTIPTGTFTDDTALTYSSSGEGAGISFTTDTWSGTPNNAETLSITVTATDAAGNTATDTFDIVISGNSAPTGITLTNASVPENTTAVGTFSTTDTDGSDSHTYTFVSGAGDDDNGEFLLDTTTGVLSFAAAPDYENPTDRGGTDNDNSYFVRVETNDGNGGTYEQNFVITVTNVNEPVTFTIDAITDASVSEGVAYTSATPALSGGTPNGSVTYTKSGNDADDFTINASTGVVSMVARDYETPADADTSNDYEITITATDDDGNTAEQSWTVSVTDYLELGGASIIPALWVKANEGITEASNVITGWTDQSPSAGVATPTGSPVLSSSFINFNPSVLFDQTDDYFEFTRSPVIKGRDNFTFIAVAGSNNTSNLAHQHLFGANHDNSVRIALRGGRIALHRTNVGDIILSDANQAIAQGDIGIVAISRSGSNGNDFATYQDGAEKTDTSADARYTFEESSTSVYIGRRGRSGERLNGQIAELVVFEDVLSAADLDKVQTHLAIKYGITLDSDVANYVNAAGTSVFDNSGTYVNDIVGIAKDDTSVLDQRISKSKNSGAILTISTDATFTGVNSGHTGSLTDGQYLIIGNDGGATTTQLTETPGTTTNRLVREWKVENTGSVGEINLKFDGLDDTYTLYTDADGDFSAGATEVGALNTNGEIAATLADGTYFTLIIADGPLTTWTGTTNSDWGTATNWTDGVPTATHDVIIPKTTNQPTAAAAVTVNKVTINSGASLIANSTFSGHVIYNREINFVSGNLAGWYLMASPVAGETYDDAYIAANDIAEGTGNNRGIATYNTIESTWYYYESGATARTFTSGQGYAIKKQTSTGAISFIGTLNDADVSIMLTNSGRGFTLLGNPYTSYLNSVTFLQNETAISDTRTLWVWNQGTGFYEVKTIADAFTIAPGQGFFVKANTGPIPAFNFSEANQSHSATDTFQKSTKTQVKLDISDGAIENYCKIYYSEETTSGFDVGYDGELFSGAPNPFAIYTHLVSDSEGKHYQIQSLPYSDIENMVIPVGINATSGKEISISADVKNFPAGVHLYLEDKLENSFTQLDKNDAKYTISLSEDLEGIGRFFLRASSSDLNNFSSTSLENISIYASSKNNLRIVGIQDGNVKLRAYNILGAQIISTSFKANGKNDVKIPSLAAGIYVIHLEMAIGKVSRKVVVE